MWPVKTNSEEGDVKRACLLRRSLIGFLLLGAVLGAVGSPSSAYAQDTSVDSNAATPQLTYSTYLGGSNDDRAVSVAIGPLGEIYVLGESYSADLLGRQVPISGSSDLYVAKFNAAGTQLLYLKTYGTPDGDEAHKIAVDGQGNVYVTAGVYPGNTFPTKNPLWATQPDNSNSALFKLDPQGNVVFSTYLPLATSGAFQNLALDKAGNVYVTGTFSLVEENGTSLRAQIGLFKISPDGKTVLLEKKLGGEDNEGGRAVALDKNGNIYLAGEETDGTGNFPVTANAHQPECGELMADPNNYCTEEGIVIVLDAAGNVTYASYNGGSSSDEPLAIAVDATGMIVLAGSTTSNDFPLANALQSQCALLGAQGFCQSTGFVSAIRIRSPKSALVYSTYLGSTESDASSQPTGLALDATGNAYLSGWTNGRKFPTKNAVQPALGDAICLASPDRYCYDGFLVKLTPAGALSFGTYLGGEHDDLLYDVALDAAGSVFVAGESHAFDYPTTANAYQPTDLLKNEGVLSRIAFGAVDQPVNIGVDPAAPGGHVDVTVVSLSAEAAEVGASYPVGSVLRLTAVANPGYGFAGWTGDISGKQNPVQVTVAGPLTISARFAPFAHSIWVPTVRKP